VPREVQAELGRPGGPELLSLTQASGGPTRALYWRAPAGARTVVAFHGNGESIFDEVPLASELRARGLGVMLVEYRGYGLTYGAPPTEEAVYADGEAAIAYLAARGVGRDDVALWGFSLGSGVAAEMARRGHASRLVLVAPYTSILDMGRRVAPMLPVSILMDHRFDTVSKANEIRAATLVVHGDADEVVPFEMGQAVARAIPGARLLRVPGAHHMDALASAAAFDAAVAHVVTRP
jgi:pimeloyl-ACP methyl ester carboxylesterase